MNSKALMKRLILLILCGLYQLPLFASAEGSQQIGMNQYMYEYNSTSTLLSNATHPMYVILNSPTEVINVSMCGVNSADDVSFSIYQTTLDGSGKYIETGSAVVTRTRTQETQSGLCAVGLTGNLPNPLSPPTNFKWAPQDSGLGAGVYQIRLFNDSGQFIRPFDITVTSSKSVSPNPNLAQGRLFAYNWAYNGNGYLSANAADTNYYVKVPGGTANTDFVWQLDLQEFAGFVYDVVANDIGVDAENVSYSVPFLNNSVTELYPIYLSYPNDANPPPSTPPQITGYYFTDDEGVDHTISPNNSADGQNTGFFNFTSDVAGTYMLIIDANQDGVFGNTTGGIDDTYLFGRMDAGANAVRWDGTDNDGDPLPEGSFQAQLQGRVGEYHFIAGDAETSGGGSNDGLTIYGVNPSGSLYGVDIFWDDLTGFDPDKSGNGGSTLPFGVKSVVGQTTGSFRHTWGTFGFDSFGNEAYVDTYVYGLASFASTSATIAEDNTASSIGLGKTATIDGNKVTFDFYIENFLLGPALNSLLDNLTLTDNLDSTFGAGNYVVTPLSAASVIDGGTLSNLNVNTNYNGSTDTDLLLSGSSLGPGETVQLRLEVTVTTPTDRGDGFGVYKNSAFTTATTPTGTSMSDISTNSTDPDVDMFGVDGVTPDGGTGANDNNGIATDNTTPTGATFSLDLGDAPDTTPGISVGNYQTLGINGGPNHFIVSDLYIGTTVDADDGSLQNSDADADDLDNLADEDGVLFNGSLTTETPSYSVTVNVLNSSGTGAYLVSWIDFDLDGSFDEDEGVVYDSDPGTAGVQGISSSASSQSVTLTWTDIGTNMDILPGITYARFRLSADVLTTADSLGAASGGEVEDYQTEIDFEETFTISGTVYHDLEPDGKLDSSDPATGLTLYVKLVDEVDGDCSSLTATTADAVETVTVGDGTYAFTDVRAGSYCLILDDNTALSDPTPFGANAAGWLYINPEIGYRGSTVVDQDIPNQNFGLYNGSRLTGTVFFDDGFLSTTAPFSNNADANNALQSATEQRASGKTVTLSDGTNSKTVQTSGDGSYTFYLPASWAATVELTVVGEVGTGYNADGLTALYTASSFKDANASKVSFSQSAGSSSSYNFGIVNESRFYPDQNGQTRSGGTISYGHLLTPGTLGSVSFALSDGAYSYQVFRDVNCDGTVEATEQVDILTTGFSVDESWQRDKSGRLASCLIELHVNVPAGEPGGRLDIATLQASLSWVNSSATDSQSVTDVTTITSGGQLRLEKRVRNVSEGAAFGIKSEAEPGHVLEYCISYQNIGTEDVTATEFLDPLPYFTSLKTDAYGIGDAAISWNNGTSPLVLTAAQDSDAGAFIDGVARVDIGTVPPGLQGEVCYQAEIN